MIAWYLQGFDKKLTLWIMYCCKWLPEREGEMIWTLKIAGNTPFPHFFSESSVPWISSVLSGVAQAISMPSYSCL